MGTHILPLVVALTHSTPHTHWHRYRTTLSPVAWNLAVVVELRTILGVAGSRECAFFPYNRVASLLPHYYLQCCVQDKHFGIYNNKLKFRWESQITCSPISRLGSDGTSCGFLGQDCTTFDLISLLLRKIEASCFLILRPGHTPSVGSSDASQVFWPSLRMHTLGTWKRYHSSAESQGISLVQLSCWYLYFRRSLRDHGVAHCHLKSLSRVYMSSL